MCVTHSLAVFELLNDNLPEYTNSAEFGFVDPGIGSLDLGSSWEGSGRYAGD
jgi:hypothetical protein